MEFAIKRRDSAFAIPISNPPYVGIAPADTTVPFASSSVPTTKLSTSAEFAAATTAHAACSSTIAAGMASATTAGVFARADSMAKSATSLNRLGAPMR